MVPGLSRRVAPDGHRVRGDVHADDLGVPHPVELHDDRVIAAQARVGERDQRASHEPPDAARGDDLERVRRVAVHVAHHHVSVGRRVVAELDRARGSVQHRAARDHLHVAVLIQIGERGHRAERATQVLALPALHEAVGRVHAVGAHGPSIDRADDDLVARGAVHLARRRVGPRVRDGRHAELLDQRALPDAEHHEVADRVASVGSVHVVRARDHDDLRDVARGDPAVAVVVVEVDDDGRVAHVVHVGRRRVAVEAAPGVALHDVQGAPRRDEAARGDAAGVGRVGGRARLTGGRARQAPTGRGGRVPTGHRLVAEPRLTVAALAAVLLAGAGPADVDAAIERADLRVPAAGSVAAPVRVAADARDAGPVSTVLGARAGVADPRVPVATRVPRVHSAAVRSRSAHAIEADPFDAVAVGVARGGRVASAGEHGQGERGDEEVISHSPRIDQSIGLAPRRLGRSTARPSGQAHRSSAARMRL